MPAAFLDSNSWPTIKHRIPIRKDSELGILLRNLPPWSFANRIFATKTLSTQNLNQTSQSGKENGIMPSLNEFTNVDDLSYLMRLPDVLD